MFFVCNSQTVMDLMVIVLGFKIIPSNGTEM